MMTRSSIPLILAPLLFVLPLALGLGCQPGPAPAIALPVCASSSWCDKVSQLRPARAVDYLELRSLGNGVETTGCVVATTGTKCSGAADQASCQRAVATIPPAWELLGNRSYSLVTTAGDQVQTISAARAALTAFLLAIDSAEEAAFIARAAGYRVDCAAPLAEVVHAVSQGYEVIGMKGSACGPGDDVYRYTLLVRPDGSITEEKTELVKMTDPHCVFE